METVEFFDEMSETLLKVSSDEIVMTNGDCSMSVGLTDAMVRGIMAAMISEKIDRLFDNIMKEGLSSDKRNK